MRIYKWELLKDEAARHVGTKGRFVGGGAEYTALATTIEQVLTGQPVKKWRDNYKDIILKAQKVVDNWDIREAGKLLLAFPNIIAKKHRGKSFVCDMDERGNWCLCFS